MGESASQIRQELDQYRDSAAERLAEIEDRVGNVTDEARHVVEDVQTQVQTQVKETTEQIRQTFDIKHQMSENPLVAVGAGLLAGFILGGGLSGGGGSRSYQGGYRSQSGIGAHLNRTVRESARSSGLNDTLSAAGSALSKQLMGSVRANVDQHRQESLNDPAR
ncbi:MAG TPA: hypothetical protein VGT61_01130 [Thermomicrobiales bacterium]|jgi:ElaB/YqjD/DUF883 family membrane-anchored ribosome-binding protein|nr:hypothetical protein [Thermomicrobiales bacterium]